jgi:dihydropyrimidinase
LIRLRHPLSTIFSGLQAEAGVAMSILVRGGTVVNADHSFRADVLIEGGLIKTVAANLEAPAGAEILDAGGALVMPGGD